MKDAWQRFSVVDGDDQSDNDNDSIRVSMPGGRWTWNSGSMWRAGVQMGVDAALLFHPPIDSSPSSRQRQSGRAGHRVA